MGAFGGPISGQIEYSWYAPIPAKITQQKEARIRITADLRD